MRTSRESQLAPDQGECGGTYHVVSRVVWRNFALQEEEREMFRYLMRQYEAFCGVEVQAYCVMSNHFHILVRVPARPEGFEGEMEDETFFEHLSLVYSEGKVLELRQMVYGLRRTKGGWRAVKKIKEEHLRRMYDLSEFLKALKQRFTLWYNKKHGKTGTMWEGRFKSVLVQGGRAAQLTAAYIDLNPLRAGMVKDPSEYRWCSYAEALGGGKYAENARAGVLSLMKRREHDAREMVDEAMTAKNALEEYRMLLAIEGEAVDQESAPASGERQSVRKKRARGYSRAEAEKILENGGKLGAAELLRCKVRYFTDGGVLGTRSFVNKVFAAMKEKDAESGNERFAKRTTGARKWKHLDDGGMYSLRCLRKEIVE